MSVEVPDEALRAARSTARRVARIHNGVVPFDDLVSVGYEWLVKHRDHVEQWATEGRHGRNKLHRALYRAGQRYAHRERTRLTGGQLGDHYFYTPPVVEELLPAVWAYDEWTYNGGVPEDDTGRRKPKAPNEGNDRLAALVDVKWAVAGLSAEDQQLLRDRYEDGGLSVQVIAATYGVSEQAIRYRLGRVLQRVCDRLGGEPPWWTPKGKRGRPRND